MKFVRRRSEESSAVLTRKQLLQTLKMKPVKISLRSCTTCKTMPVQFTKRNFVIKPFANLTKLGLSTQSNWKICNSFRPSQMFQIRCYFSADDEIYVKFHEEMKELHNSGQILKSYNLYKKMKQHVAVDISVLEHLIDGFAAGSEHLDKMLEVFDEYIALKRVEPANLLRLWNAVLNCLRFHKSILIFKYFTMLTQNSLIKPDQYTYYTVIHAHYHWQDALALFRNMPIQFRDTQNYVAILDKLATARQANVAFDIYKNMYKKEIGTPNLIICGLLLKAARNAKSREMLESAIAEMRANRLKHNQVTFGTIIDAYSHMNDVDKMTEWFERMASAGVYTNAYHFNSILSSFNSSSQISKLLQWYDSMKLLGVRPSDKTYKVVLSQLCRYGTPNHMVTFFRQTEKKVPFDVSHYSAIIHGFLRVGDVTSADSYFEEMKKKGIQPNGQLLAAMRKAIPEKYRDSPEHQGHLHTVAAVEVPAA